jgi:O-acetyl-ADP-ribose deacetylase (regulator of RNase III)
MIEEIQGDLLETDCQLIAHGVNCQGVMGSGVARALYEKWPRVKDFYLDYFTEFNAGVEGENFLGQIDVLIVDRKTGQQVANCFTQQYYGGDGGRYLSYDALVDCMKRLYSYANQFGIKEIAMPKIGCGLAGGDWEIVKAILNSIFTDDFTIKVYIK